VSWRGHAWLALPARLYLGFVFFYACLHKIADPAAFALDVATYQLLPLWLVNLTALVLPWIELVTSVMIVIGYRTRAAALLIAGMMLVFIVALGWALGQGLDMSCGCFASSSTDHPISWLTMLRDAAWFGLTLYVLFFDHNPVGLDRWLAARRSRTRAFEAPGR